VVAGRPLLPQAAATHSLSPLSFLSPPFLPSRTSRPGAKRAGPLATRPQHLAPRQDSPDGRAASLPNVPAPEATARAILSPCQDAAAKPDADRDARTPQSRVAWPLASRHPAPRPSPARDKADRPDPKPKPLTPFARVRFPFVNGASIRPFPSPLLLHAINGALKPWSTVLPLPAPFALPRRYKSRTQAPSCRSQPPLSSRVPLALGPRDSREAVRWCRWNAIPASSKPHLSSPLPTRPAYAVPSSPSWSSSPDCPHPYAIRRRASPETCPNLVQASPISAVPSIHIVVRSSLFVVVRSPKVKDKPKTLIYFLNHVWITLLILWIIVVMLMRFDDSRVWFLEMRCIRVAKIEPRDNTLNMCMIL
jgi:hypothetical protein